MSYRYGKPEMDSGLLPISAKLYISLQPSPGPREPLLSGLLTHFCQWRSQQNSMVCGGTLLQEAHQAAKNPARGGLQSHLSGHTLKVGWGQRHSPDAIQGHFLFLGILWIHSIWHSIRYQPMMIGQHNTGLRLALGAFCTSPVSSMNTEVNEAPLEEPRLKLSMQYYYWKLFVPTSCPAQILPNHKRSVKLLRYLTAPADFLDARATKFQILKITYQLG